MIVEPKKIEKVLTVNDLNKREIPRIEFLCENGQLVYENFEVSDENFFVSVKDNQRYGKVEHYKDKSVYYIKQYRGGRPGEYVPDPYGPLSTPYDLAVTNNKRGQRFCEYLSVRQDLFDVYQEYLYTRNPRTKSYLDKQIKENNYR